ncbi:MAG TPA: hypothetical protein VF139_06740 [Candidatus Polarisedimenticolaceae bacterium]
MTPGKRRLRQIVAVATLETRRRLFGRGAVALYLLAAFPVAVFGTRAVAGLMTGVTETIAMDDGIFAMIYRLLLLRFSIFLGCLVVFSTLYRGEVLDKTLHYPLLAPLRRSTWAAGKFLSGLLAAWLLFGGVTACTWMLTYLAHGPGALAGKLLSPEGLLQLLAYLAATGLACAGYGALFFVFGLFFRMPILPALVVLAWESANFLLPAFLKKLSVVHYVESFLPVPVDMGPLAILASPSSPWVAVPGIALLVWGLLRLAAWKLDRVEVLYGAE